MLTVIIGITTVMINFIYIIKDILKWIFMETQKLPQKMLKWVRIVLTFLKMSMTCKRLTVIQVAGTHMHHTFTVNMQKRSHRIRISESHLTKQMVHGVCLRWANAVCVAIAQWLIHKNSHVTLTQRKTHHFQELVQRKRWEFHVRDASVFNIYLKMESLKLRPEDLDVLLY